MARVVVPRFAARQGTARHGKARLGKARLGKARHGMAWQGEGANGTFYLSDVQCFERRTK